MRKEVKRIIAIILCITMVINFDNSGLFALFNRDVISGKELSEVESKISDYQESNEVVESDETAESEKTDESTDSTASEKMWDEVDERTIMSETDTVAEGREKDSISDNARKSTSEDTNREVTSESKAVKENETQKPKKDVERQTFSENYTEIQQETQDQLETTDNETQNADILIGEYTQKYYAAAKETVTATMAESRDISTYPNLIITVRTPADWTALARITRKTDLKGVDVLLSSDSTPGVADPQTWNLTENQLKCTYTDEDSGNTVTDYGLGCKKYPFAGNLTSQFTLSINTAVTLFDYISSDAEIGTVTYKITLKYSGYNDKRRGGLANHLVLSSGEYRYKYKNLNLTGTIGHNSSANAVAVGGLFGDVSVKEGAEGAKFVIDGKMQIPDISYVYGRAAGGIIGQVDGNIDVELVSGTAIIPAYVCATGECAGGIVGKLVNGAHLYTSGTSESSYFAVQNTTTGNLNARIKGTGYIGGLVGYVQNSKVEVSYIKKYDSIRGTHYAGGLIGVVECNDLDKPVQVSIDHFVLCSAYIYQEKDNITDDAHGAGGVVGKYVTNLTDTLSYLKIASVTSETVSRENTDITRTIPEIGTANNDTDARRKLRYNGGVIGNIYGNNVEIYDIEFSHDKYRIVQVRNNIGDGNVSGSDRNATKIAGNIAGGIIGKNISIHDIVIASEKVTTTNDVTQDTGISGWAVGGLIGEAGYYKNVDQPGTTKIRIKNVEIKSIHTWDGEVYFGGLIGRCGAGTVVALEGEINLAGLSKNPKNTTTKTSDYTGYADLPGTIDNISAAGNQNTRGFVAGYAQESLIYWEPDAVVTRPIVTEEGIVYYGTDNTTDINSKNIAYANYCIDDIGNCGAVYRNVEDNGVKVINFENDYGLEVTGTVTTTEVEGDTFYQIDSLGDALRLAIAGNTYDYFLSSSRTLIPRFGAKCFAEDGNITVENLMAANYLISTDLSLEEIGVHGFLSNDTDRYGKYGFSGIMKGALKGVDEKYTITMNFISKQYYGGLFPYLLSGASFDNLSLDGYVSYAKGDYNTGRGAMGTIAAEAKAQAGGGFRFNKVDITTVMRAWYANVSAWDNTRMYSYGGYVGLINLANGSLEVTNCHIAPQMNGMQAISFSGGLVGRIITARTAAITVTDSTIATQFMADTYFTNSCNGNWHQARCSAMIGFIGDAYNNVGSTNGADNLPGTMRDATYATVDVERCTVSGSVIDLSQSGSTLIVLCGGFLGYAWLNVEATFNNITIQDGAQLKIKGAVGGLVSCISGKCDVENVTISDITITQLETNGNTKRYGGFLFGNAKYAFITLKQDSYHIATTVPVPTGYDYFDEIVGWNMLNDGTNGGDCRGGILNIINSDFKSFKPEDYGEGENYCSYINQVVTLKNTHTRYYYNLFTGDEEDWKVVISGREATIDSPEKMMTWNAAFYSLSDNSYTKRFFTPYFDFTAATNKTDYANINVFHISQDIDLNGFSYYPIYVWDNRTVNGDKGGGEKAQITLYGKEISTLEDGLYSGGSGINKYDRENQYQSPITQHYMMHASVFYGVANCTIKNLKLTGNAAYNNNNSAILCGGNMTGTVTVQGILLQEALINNYANDAGLLIARIGDSDSGASYVTIDDIQTSYTVPRAQPVASALIRTVGNSSATDVRVIFKNMKVSSAAKSTDNVSVADNVFQRASFIYEYNYTSVIEDNRCYVLYTFDYGDTAKEISAGVYELNDIVTYGKEIGGKTTETTVEYNDMTRAAVAAIPGKLNPLQVAITNARKNYYLPYIYQGKNLFINPLTGNLNAGCGTYEDPYLISNNRQFIALYSYLTYKTEKYASMLAEWQVNKVGGNGDAHECSLTLAEPVAHETKTYGEAEFPTRGELRTAYYCITASIDFDDMSDWNDNLMASEFNGLGTLEKPFAGVIVGRQVAGVNPTVTLPRQGYGNSSQENYGLIQYMQGAVVKDLNIVTPDDAEAFIKVTGMAGGVAAKIIGGDNIIDNVSVGVKFSAYNSSDVTNNTVHMGGYVGLIDKGALILRNMHGDNAVATCEFRHQKINTTNIHYYKTNDTSGETADTTSDYVGLLVGEVLDGYVLYEHNDVESAFEDADKKVLDKTDLVVSDNAQNALALVNRFNIINGYAIDQAVADDGKIEITTTDADDDEKGIAAGSLVIDIQNGEELEVMALALNSDELSVHYSQAEGTGSTTSYTQHTVYTFDYTAKCRKMDYSGVGTICTDRNMAQLCDDGNASDMSNIYLYPYLLYKYADFIADGVAHSYEENYAAYCTKTMVGNIAEAETSKYYSSKFNKIDNNVYGYTTTYQLASTATETFDVSDYGISFRGFGELYRVQVSDFRANFNGNGKDVKIYMDRNALDDRKDFSTGMFNKLTYDARVQGTLNTSGSTSTVQLSGYADANASPLIIENLNIVDSSFINYDHDESDSNTTKGTFTGAVAGQVEGIWDFTEVKLKAVEGESRIAGDKYVGGIVGSVNATKWVAWDNTNDNYHLASNVIHFKNCGVNGSDTYEVTVESTSTTAGTGQAIGGIAGGVGHYHRYHDLNLIYYFGTVDFLDCSVQNCNIATKAEGCTGGFAGYVGFRRYDSNHYRSCMGRVTVENSDGNRNLENIKKVNLSSDITTYVVTNREFNSSMGGLFGKVQSINMDDNGSRGNNDYAAMVIDGFNVDQLTVSPSTSTETLAYYTGEVHVNINGIGGVIGTARLMNLDMTDIKVKNATIGNQHNNMNTGGVIGYLPPVQGEAFKEKSKINATNILVKDSSIISNTGGAGGFFGRMRTEYNMITNGQVDTCTISSNYLDVGGIIGYLNAYRGAGSFSETSDTQTKLESIQVKNSSIMTLDNSTDGATKISAGGIIGRSDDETPYDGSRHRTIVLQDIYVGKGCDIRGAKAAGGIVGSLTYSNHSERTGLYLKGYIGVGADALYDDLSGTYTWTEDITSGNLANSTDYTNIAGRIAGGITGYDNTTSARSVPAEIWVANCRIYSYDRAQKQERCASGGIVGYKRGNAGTIIYDYITVKHNLILSSGRGQNAQTTCSYRTPVLGGVYGWMEGSGNRSHMPNVVLQDNSIGFYDLSGNSSDSKYEAFKTLSLSSKEVKLFYQNTTTNQVEAVNWQDLTAPITENNIKQYSMGVGNFIGFADSTRQISILKPTVSYSDSIGSIPVIDVANKSYSNVAARSDYGRAYPYGYRDYIHIFYIKDGSPEGMTKLDTSITSDGEDEYQFYDIDSIIARYKSVVNEGATATTTEEIKQATYDFIKSDRLNMYMTYGGTNYNLFSITDDNSDANYYNSTYKRADGTYIMTSSTSNLNGVSALVLDGQSAQHLGDFADFILTGGSGTGNDTTLSNMYDGNSADSFLYVSCVNAVITPDGLIKKNNNEYGTGDNKSTTSVNSRNHYQLVMEKDNNRSCPYDEFIAVVGEGTYYTITLVKYTYKCKTTSGTVNTETIYIPIYVKEKVTMRSNVRVVGDEDYSYNDAKNNGKSGTIVIAHGSIYTIYAEFAYDAIRLKSSFMETRTDKTLKFEGLQGLPKGTKLTMVDAQTGRPYYYLVEAESDAVNRVNNIKFTDFIDVDGNNYAEKCIGNGDITLVENAHKMLDGNVLNGSCAIERFYIFVEPPEGSINITFRLSVDAQTKNQANTSMNEYFKLYPDPVIPMTFIPGTQISFSGVTKTATDMIVGTREVTEIMGKSGETEIDALYISQDRSIEVDAAVDISLLDSTSPYWTNKENTIDSTNNGKYIDVAVSLLDESNKEVPWPEGTNIVFNNGQPGTVNGSTVYLYKDSDCYKNSSARFAYNTLDRDLDGNETWYFATFHDDLTNSYISRWITKDENGWFYYVNQTEKNYSISELEISELSNRVHISFNFDVADIDDYSGNKYKVRLKLYRSSDPNYPIEEEIAENTDYDRYTEYEKEAWGQSDKDMGTAVSVDDLMELGINVYQNASQKEVINFKNRFDFTNVINSKNADKAKVDRDKAAESAYMVTYRLQKKNMSGVYETISWDASPFKLYDKIIVDGNITNQELQHITIDDNDVCVEYKKFTSGEILTGTDNIKYVTQWDLQLEADIPLLSEDKTLWTNYKVVATYLPYDDGVDSNELDIKAPPTTDATAVLTDFYIFTVAKLKTDL